MKHIIKKLTGSFGRDYIYKLDVEFKIVSMEATVRGHLVAPESKTALKQSETLLILKTCRENLTREKEENKYKLMHALAAMEEYLNSYYKYMEPKEEEDAVGTPDIKEEGITQNSGPQKVVGAKPLEFKIPKGKKETIQEVKQKKSRAKKAQSHQDKILKLSKRKDLKTLSYKRIGDVVGIKNISVVRHHLDKMVKEGLIDKGVIDRRVNKTSSNNGKNKGEKNNK